MAPFIRTTRTASGATAVQVVWRRVKGRPVLDHIGSAHNDRELAILRGVAQQVINQGQGTLDFEAEPSTSTFTITASKSARLWDGLVDAYRALGFDVAVPDSAFGRLVLARVIEPTSKFDSIRVLEDLGVEAPSYATIKRRLADCVAQGWRGALEEACARHVHASDLRFCLYDVTTLFWETHQGDGFREPGFSKERRLEPQVTVGLLTTADGFPLRVEAFEGNRAEVKTMIPVLSAFAQAHTAAGITVVADAGMMSEANARALQDSGFSFIVGYGIPKQPWVVADWRTKHPGQGIKDGQVFIQRTDIGTKAHPRPAVIYYQWRAKRARRDLKSIDKTLTKARLVAAGQAPLKKNRFLTINDKQVTINQDLVTDAQARAGLRAYITDAPYRDGTGQPLPPKDDPVAERRRLRTHAGRVIAAYHDLWHVEQAFRMSKHDLAARPVHSWVKDSINAHLTIVFAALAVGQWIEATTGISLRRFLQALRRIRRVEIDIAGHTITAEDPIGPVARDAIDAIHAATTGRAPN
jgi:hypothetical protein